MISKSEIREWFAGQTRLHGGVRCNYCGQHKKVALYRVYNMQRDSLVDAVCPDCIEKAKKSRIASQWLPWR